MQISKKILVVDDIQSNIEVLLDILDANYDVMVALNGFNAIEIAKEDKPDLILLDIMMPSMDGYEVCEHLKSDYETMSIPVIFITAKSEEESIERAYDVGGVDYVTKPFKPKELLARVNTHLKLKNLIDVLETKVDCEIERRMEHESALLHQSRLASVGEMMDAIAHQWVQPISIVSTQVEILSFDVLKNKIDEEYIENFQNKFRVQIEHMMSTLREFRNFFRPSTDYKDFNAKVMINRVLALIEDDFKKKNIQIDSNNCTSVRFRGIENEFIHLILNIVNNAKDALIQNSIKNKKISINIFEDDTYKFIEIEDNAGGIKESIIDDIFKMNITTKENNAGTGMGLYISSKIAAKYNGTISAKNNKDGVKFTFKKSKF